MGLKLFGFKSQLFSSNKKDKESGIKVLKYVQFSEFSPRFSYATNTSKEPATVSVSKTTKPTEINKSPKQNSEPKTKSPVNLNTEQNNKLNESSDKKASTLNANTTNLNANTSILTDQGQKPLESTAKLKKPEPLREEPKENKAPANLVGILKSTKKSDSEVLAKDIVVVDDVHAANENLQKSTLVHMTENADDKEESNDAYKVHVMRHASVSSEASYESGDTLESENALHKVYSSQAASIFFGDDLEEESDSKQQNGSHNSQTSA